MKERIINKNIISILTLACIIGVFFWIQTLNYFIANCYSLKGIKYSSFRDYNLSEVNYKKAMKHDPHKGKIHFLYGSMLLNTGRIDEGIAELNKALLNFRDVYLYRNLGKAYLGKEEYDKAMYFYGKTFETGIGFLDSLCNMGTVYLNNGETDKAIKIFKKALTYNNDHLLAIKNIGTAYLRKGDYHNAIHQLGRALGREPENVITLNALGMAYLKTRAYEKSMAIFRKILRLDDKNIRAHNNLGNMYYEKKEYNKAIECWKKTLQIDPGNKIAKHNISKTVNKLPK